MSRFLKRLPLALLNDSRISELMNSSPLHFFPLTLPYTLILVVLLAVLLILLQLQGSQICL